MNRPSTARKLAGAAARGGETPAGPVTQAARATLAGPATPVAAALSAMLPAMLLAALVVALPAAPAAAHHSFAMYDRSSTETLTGKLTRFIPGANHAQMHFELLDEHGSTVIGEDGSPVLWGFETGPAARIARQGVTVNAFPLGTIITVNVNPLRDGRPFGVLTGSLIHCGTELPEGGCTEETGEVFNPSPD